MYYKYGGSVIERTTERNTGGNPGGDTVRNIGGNNGNSTDSLWPDDLPHPVYVGPERPGFRPLRGLAPEEARKHLPRSQARDFKPRPKHPPVLEVVEVPPVLEEGPQGWSVSLQSPNSYGETKARILAVFWNAEGEGPLPVREIANRAGLSYGQTQGWLMKHLGELVTRSLSRERLIPSGTGYLWELTPFGERVCEWYARQEVKVESP